MPRRGCGVELVGTCAPVTDERFCASCMQGVPCIIVRIGS